MAACSKKLIINALLLFLSVALSVGAAVTPAGGSARLAAAGRGERRTMSAPPQANRAPGRREPASRRIVSLVPNVTEMLFAIGAGSQVVGVGNFDNFPPEVAKLPRVGALLDPDTERILSLRPGFAVLYGSQTDLQMQLTRAGITTYMYRHGGIDTIYQTMHELGGLTGHRTDADRIIGDLRKRIEAVKASVKDRPRPRVVLVMGRQPKTLREIYASGGRGFLHEMLDVAGGQNVFADVDRESVQPSNETILARAPDVILELQAEAMIPVTDAAAEKNVWSALPSLPAVRNRRVYMLRGQYLVVPGPRFAQATETIARTLHPEAYR